MASYSPFLIRTGLVAHASSRLDADALAAARRQPFSPPGRPPLSLRHADEQTLAALAAVASAASFAPIDGFGDWAVVAGTRFAGRAGIADALTRFLAEGSWGVSPHVIPHCSPHAVSGTVSLALGTHGPNFAVESGDTGVLDALLAAATLLSDGVPGVWVVLTRANSRDALSALALALVPCPWPREFTVAADRPLSAEDLERALTLDVPRGRP